MTPNPPSRIRSGLYPPSSTSAATVQYLNDRTLTFASEWYFKPEGVKLVKERFEGELGKRRIDAVHGYNNEDQTFSIRCSPRDVNRIWPLFYMVVATIIKDETGEEEDDDNSQASWTAAYEEDPPLQSALIEPLQDYRKRTGQDETLDEDDTQPHPSEAETDPNGLFPEDIRYFQSKTVWPQNMDPDLNLTLNLEDVVSGNDIKEIESLTSCRLVKVLNERKIYIGGYSEKKCTLALGKLDILYKYKLMAPYKKHIFYSEGKEDFKLILRPIVDVQKLYFESTLLELLQISPKCNYRNLPEVTTVRIAPYNHARCLYASSKTVKVAAAVKPEDKDRGFVEWIDFKYSGKGTPPEYLRDLGSVVQTQEGFPAPMQSTPAVQRAPVQPIVIRDYKDAVIEQWTKDVSSSTIQPGIDRSDAFAANSGSRDNNETKPTWDIYKPFSDTPVLRNEAKVKQVGSGLAKGLENMRMARSARGAAALPTITVQSSVPQQFVHCQRSTPTANSPPWTASQQTRQQTTITSTAQPVTNQSPTQSSVSPTRAVLPAESSNGLAASPTVQPAAARPASQTSIHSNADIDSFCYRQPEHSLLDDEISVIDFTDPIMQPLGWEGHTTESQHAPNSRVECLQLLSEVETRTFHNTMNQRAPNAKSNPYTGRLPGPDPVKAALSTANSISVIDPLPEFVQELEESFQEMMKPTQGFRGKLQVQAEFGRILLNSIHKKHVTSKDSTDNLKSSETLQRLLNSADFTSFTNVLTTSPGEMPFILNLSDCNGKERWDKGSKDWAAEYEFCFIDNLAAAHQNPRFRVVIDAETFVTQIKRYRPLGSIYVHGVTRHWDFQLTATGVESGRGLRENYGELAAAVESSLHVPGESTTPMLFFKLDEPMSKRFELAAVRVYRIRCYKSNDSRSILKVAELHSLDVHMTSDPKKSSTFFKLSSSPSDRKPCEKPGLGHWYEVSISSAQLDSLLEQNENLEIGEEGQWTPEGLSRLGYAKSIYLPALDMLKKMDGIGQYNNNGVNVRSGTSTTTSQATQKPKDEFW